MTPHPASWSTARWGVTLMFFTNGAVMAAIMPRYPELKSALGLTNAGFGLLVAAIAVGSILASGLPAVVIRRFGARAAATGGTLLMAVAMALVGLSPSVWTVALLLACLGVLDAVVDAAQNVHGLRVERGLGRTVINSLHASWSVGAALSGFAAALAAGADVPLALHLAVSGAVVVVIALVATRLAVPPAAATGSDVDVVSSGTVSGETAEGGPGEGAAASSVAYAPSPVSADGSPLGGPSAVPAPAADPRPSRRPWAVLLVLGVLALIGALIEDVGNNWSANFLHDSVGLGVALAGYGYVTLLVFQFIGRILGDRMTDRLGRNRVALIGGACIAAGFAAVVLAPSAGTGFLAFALAGFGCATLIPAAYAAADTVPGFRDGTGVTVVGWIMRVGFLATSPVIGAMADAVGLRLAFLVPLAAGVVVVVISGVLLRRGRRLPAG